MSEGSACEKKIADTECGERMREKKKIKTLYINLFETPDRPPLAAATGTHAVLRGSSPNLNRLLPLWGAIQVWGRVETTR